MKLFSQNKIDEGALPVTEEAAAVKPPSEWVNPGRPSRS